MSRYPGTVHYKDLEKVAAYLGLDFRRQRGSHRQHKTKGMRGVTIPTYKDIEVNSHLFKSILAAMGITKKKFFEILRK